MSLQPFPCVFMYIHCVHLSSHLCIVLCFTFHHPPHTQNYPHPYALICPFVRALVFYIHKMSHAKYRNNVAGAWLYTCNTHIVYIIYLHTYIIYLLNLYPHTVMYTCNSVCTCCCRHFCLFSFSLFVLLFRVIRKLSV